MQPVLVRFELQEITGVPPVPGVPPVAFAPPVDLLVEVVVDGEPPVLVLVSPPPTDASPPVFVLELPPCADGTIEPEAPQPIARKTITATWDNDCVVLSFKFIVEDFQTLR